MDKKIYSDTEYAIIMAQMDNITGYRVFQVDVEREWAMAERLSDGVYGYIWLWTNDLEFTPMEW